MSIIDKKAKQKQEEEKDKQVNKIKSFLIENRPKFQSLGCGFHNGEYYFGTKLYREGKSYTAIITSARKCYINFENNKEIKNVFGLSYREEIAEDCLDNMFSNKAVERWLFSDTDSITFKSIYEKLIQKAFKPYIYLEDERKYKLLACYRIAGFFMSIWRSRARLFIYAEMGSAKSRLTTTLHNTGFNSVALGDWTLPYIRAMIESTRGETHIDDYESLDDEKKKMTDRLVKIGYMRGFKSGKMSDNTKRKPQAQDLFNTTTLNNTEGINIISNDRCITIRIPKIESKDYDTEPDFENPLWSELREELYILGLKYPTLVNDAYDKVKSEKIRARLFNIIKPELTIAKLIGQDVYDDIESFWAEEIEQRDETDYETNWEFLAYKRIYEIMLSTLSTQSTLSTLSTLSTSNYFSLKYDVINPIGKSLYDDHEFNKISKGMSITIGKALSRNTIFKKKQVNGKWKYKVNFDEFKSFLKAKRFLKPIQDALQVDKVDNSDKVEEEVCNSTFEDQVYFVGSYGSEGCPWPYFIDKFGKEALDKLLEQGQVMENPAGVLRVVE